MPTISTVGGGGRRLGVQSHSHAHIRISMGYIISQTYMHTHAQCITWGVLSQAPQIPRVAFQIFILCSQIFYHWLTHDLMTDLQASISKAVAFGTRLQACVSQCFQRVLTQKGKPAVNVCGAIPWTGGGGDGSDWIKERKGEKEDSWLSASSCYELWGKRP